MLVKEQATIQTYVDYLKLLTDMVPDSIRRHEKFLYRVQRALDKNILSVERGSEINQAILEVAAARKRAYNGGQEDKTGADLKFRLGKAVSYFVTWAHTENYLERNFYPKNPFHKPHMKDAYYQTPERLWFLYKYEGFDVKTTAIIRFLVDTGVRVSELIGVKITDIDFDKGVVSIFQNKVGRPKEVPVMEPTIKAIRKMIAERNVSSVWLFCVDKKGDGRKIEGSQLSTTAVRRRLDRWAKKLQFRINPHSFRHGIATIWYKAYGLVPTMKLLGHIDAK